MRQKIAWHEECLENQKTSYRRDKERFEQERKRLLAYSDTIVGYEQQIARAKIESRDGFDRDRFNVHRK